MSVGVDDDVCLGGQRCLLERTRAFAWVYKNVSGQAQLKEAAIPTSILPLNASCSELNPPESLRRRPETGKCMAIRHIGWHITVMSVYMRVLFAVLTWWRDGA